MTDQEGWAKLVKSHLELFVRSLEGQKHLEHYDTAPIQAGWVS